MSYLESKRNTRAMICKLTVSLRTLLSHLGWKRCAAAHWSMAETDGREGVKPTASRRGSYFHVRRPTLLSTGPGDVEATATDADEPVSRRLRYFCRELAAVCQTRTVFGLRASYQCFSGGEEAAATGEQLVQNLAKLRRHA